MSDPVPARPASQPLLAIAAVAVILFCAVGSAAILGWLPASTGSTRDPAAAQPALAGPPALPRDPAPSAPLAEPLRHAAAPPESCRDCGTVASVREVSRRAEGSGAGAVGGAVLGGLLGNQVGGGHGRQLATVAGAIGGAVAGNQIEGTMRARHSYAVTVRLDNGSTRVVHQSAQPGWQPGDRVRIVDGVLRGEAGP